MFQRPILPELFVVRHGETEWNREGRLQGSLDSPLTDLGRSQARAIGGLVADLGLRPSTHLALTSPQGRAAETARLALGPLGFPARRDARLVEIGMGEWSGLTRGEIAARWPGRAGEPILDFYARCPGGEGMGAVAARARGLLGGLDCPTILVTHGFTLRVLCALALGLPPEEGGGLDLRQGSVVRVAAGRMERLDA